MHSAGSMYSCSAVSKSGAPGLGWMQSTGQTSMHESSLTQLPVITYVMGPEGIRPRPRLDLRRHDRIRAQLELTALGRELHVLRTPAELLPLLGCPAGEPVEEVVAVERVVVEQEHPRRGHAAAEGECVGQARVSPAQVIAVLVVGVLAVVDKQ